GNMWPMLAGIGPVLGEGEIGAFVYPDGIRTKWFYRVGKAGVGNVVAQAGEPYRLAGPQPHAAAPSGRGGRRAGEGATIAFCGRPKTRSFGQPTAGFSTGNMSYPLSDGATIVLTVATMADRTGKVYGEAVEPDEKVEGDEDAVLKSAVAWLEKQ